MLNSDPREQYYYLHLNENYWASSGRGWQRQERASTSRRNSSNWYIPQSLRTSEDDPAHWYNVCCLLITCIVRTSEVLMYSLQRKISNDPLKFKILFNYIHKKRRRYDRSFYLCLCYRKYPYQNVFCSQMKAYFHVTRISNCWLHLYM